MTFRRRPFVDSPKRTLLVFLLLGAVLNVAVAWGCVLSLQRKKPLAVSEVFRTGAPEEPVLRATAAQMTGDPLLIGARGAYGLHAGVMTQGLSYLPPLTQWGQRTPETRFGQSSAGWPLFSLRAWRYRPDAGAWQHFWSLHFDSTAAQSGRWGLPLGPLFPGFAINTVFYAAICWLLFAAPFALRRRLRLRGGRCPHCAYPIGTSGVCTECGKPVTSRPSHAVSAAARAASASRSAGP